MVMSRSACHGFSLAPHSAHELHRWDQGSFGHVLMSIHTYGLLYSQYFSENRQILPRGTWKHFGSIPRPRCGAPGAGELCQYLHRWSGSTGCGASHVERPYDMFRALAYGETLQCADASRLCAVVDE